VVSFIPRLVYFWGENPVTPFVRRLGESQNRSGRCGEEKNLFSCSGIEQISDHSALTLVTILTKISKIQLD
jgi:hypothetical protein